MDPGKWILISGVCVGFVADEITLRQFYLQVLWFYPVIIIPNLRHTHFFLIILLSEGQEGVTRELSNSLMLFRASVTEIDKGNVERNKEFVYLIPENATLRYKHARELNIQNGKWNTVDGKYFNKHF
jgi:hypothetical protein